MSLVKLKKGEIEEGGIVCLMVGVWSAGVALLLLYEEEEEEKEVVVVVVVAIIGGLMLLCSFKNGIGKGSRSL